MVSIAYRGGGNIHLLGKNGYTHILVAKRQAAEAGALDGLLKVLGEQLLLLVEVVAGAL